LVRGDLSRLIAEGLGGEKWGSEEVSRKKKVSLKGTVLLPHPISTGKTGAKEL